MNSNGLLRKHWFQVTVHFLLDMGIFALCYYLGSLLVFRQHPEYVDDNFSKYTPAFLFTAVAFSSSSGDSPVLSCSEGRPAGVSGSRPNSARPAPGKDASTRVRVE